MYRHVAVACGVFTRYRLTIGIQYAISVNGRPAIQFHTAVRRLHTYLDSAALIAECITKYGICVRSQIAGSGQSEVECDAAILRRFLVAAKPNNRTAISVIQLQVLEGYIIADMLSILCFYLARGLIIRIRMKIQGSVLIHFIPLENIGPLMRKELSF